MRLEGFVDISGMLRCGVYALCAKGVVVYVGKSKAMIARIATHRSNYQSKRKGKQSERPEWLSAVKGIFFDEVHVYPCALHELDVVERKMIDLYRPRYNQYLKPEGVGKVPLSLTINGVSLILNAPVRAEIVRRI